jgi:hypothetical protein
VKKPEEFNEWIKRQIEDNPEEAPQAAWQQISDDLDLEDSWQGIRQDLELDNLWTRIDSRLHVQDKMLRWEQASASLTSAFVLAVLALPMLLQLSLSNASQEPLVQRSHKQQSIPENAAASRFGSGEYVNKSTQTNTPKGRNGSSSAFSTTEEASVPAPIGLRGRHIDASLPTTTTTFNSEGSTAGLAESSARLMSSTQPNDPAGRTTTVFPAEIVHAETFSSDELALLQHPAKRVRALLALDEGSIALPFVQADKPELVVVQKEKKSAASFWRVGVGASGRISALLNEKTMRAMEKSSLTTPVPTFRSSFSIQAEKVMTPKLSLLTDLMLYSTAGQRYQEYQGGYYGTTDTKLRYSQLLVLGAYSPRRMGFSNRHHTRLLAGLSGGWLQQATFTGPLGRTDLSSEYRRVTAAVVVGYEYYVPLMPGVWMGYGLRGHLDLLNVYAGTAYIPASFRQTRNAFLDFTISFKYQLKNK